MKLSRRHLLATGASVGTAAAIGMPSIARGANPQVVVIGGGAGGATAARYIAKDSAGAIDVTLIEPSRTYYTCFFSNLYLGGFRTYQSIGHTYERLAIEHGINVVHDWAQAIDRDAKQVVLASGARVPYERLVVAPGIDLDYDSVPGYSVAGSEYMPHAWKSGTEIQLLKHRVETLPQGGTFLYVAPPNPYRCPPGPYERVSMIAHILKQTNPTARITVLDPKERFSKQALFMEGWETHYPGMIEWFGPDIHGGILSVEPEAIRVETDFDTFEGDAGSLVPAQKAGQVAHAAGLTDDGGWCPIVPATMQSRMDENIHVIGDASIAAAMPKSAFAANSQAKVAAMAIRGALTDARTFPSRFANTCWSLIATDDGVKVGARYTAGDDKIESAESFISQTGEDATLRRQTYEESVGWYDGITRDIFG